MVMATTLPGDYKDIVAKSIHLASNHDATSEIQGKTSEIEEISEAECARWALVGECESGHQFFKKLYCNREWCPYCGADNSPVHRRRKSRWLPKVQTMDSMGYFVIEWPIASRDQLRTRRALEEAGKTVKAVFKRSLGYDRGLRRWHFFGDKNPEVLGYNPHLNILVPGRYLGKGELNRIKGILRKRLHEPKLIVHYSYRQTPGRMLHALKYVTRATFRNRDWDNELADKLYGFKNSQVWGNWNLEQLWKTSEEGVSLSKIENGKCPICGKPIKWKSELVPAVMIEACNARDLGNGFYQIPDDKAPPGPVIGAEDWGNLENRRAGELLRMQKLEQNNRKDPSWLYRVYCRRNDLPVDDSEMDQIRKKVKKGAQQGLWGHHGS